MEFCWNLPKNDRHNWRVIHAMVERADDKQRHPHAVVYKKSTQEIYEVSNCFKNNPIRIPFMLWCKIGKVSNLKNWDIDVLNEMLIKTKVWNFYHLTEQGL